MPQWQQSWGWKAVWMTTPALRQFHPLPSAIASACRARLGRGSERMCADRPVVEVVSRAIGLLIITVVELIVLDSDGGGGGASVVMVGGGSVVVVVSGTIGDVADVAASASAIDGAPKETGTAWAAGMMAAMATRATAARVSAARQTATTATATATSARTAATVMLVSVWDARAPHITRSSRCAGRNAAIA